MSELNGKKLTYGVLQSGPIHVPTIGSIGATLDPIASATNKPVEMLVVGDYVKVTAKGPKGSNSVYIPLVNFSHFTVAE